MTTTPTPAAAAAGARRPPTPTDRWLATIPAMPPLEGPAGVAERLLLLIHYGIDWSEGWVTSRRTTYWDKLLPDRVIASTYRAGQLRRWWNDVAQELGSTPRNAAERAELEQLLRAESTPVLETLRFETEALLLRVRIVADAVRATRTPTTAAAPAAATDVDQPGLPDVVEVIDPEEL